MVPPDLPDGYLEVHTFTVDSAGNLYGGDNQYGRTQKFVPKKDADKALLILAPLSRIEEAMDPCSIRLLIDEDRVPVWIGDHEARRSRRLLVLPPSGSSRPAPSAAFCSSRTSVN